MGAELIDFSPLRDSVVPDVDGLIFGGGFPEMFLHELENNRSMKDSIRQAAASGMPVYAECGGLMYLCRKIQGLTATLMKWQAWCRAYAKCRKSCSGWAM